MDKNTRSRRICKCGQMIISEARAWKCTPRRSVRLSLACHLRKPQSKLRHPKKSPKKNTKIFSTSKTTTQLRKYFLFFFYYYCYYYHHYKILNYSSQFLYRLYNIYMKPRSWSISHYPERKQQRAIHPCCRQVACDSYTTESELLRPKLCF